MVQAVSVDENPPASSNTWVQRHNHKPHQIKMCRMLSLSPTSFWPWRHHHPLKGSVLRLHACTPASLAAP